MKKLIAILALSLSLILCLTACGSKMPYDLSGTASVELHAYNNDSTEPFAKIVVDGEDVATIVEMFNSLKLKEMKYTEPSIRGYEFWFRDENGSEIVKIELPYGPSPWLVVGGTEYPYQDVNGGVDVDYLAQLVDMTISAGPMQPEDGVDHNAPVEPLFYKSAPGLSIQHDGQSVWALPGTSSWQYMNPDGTSTGIEADSMHPLDAKEYMPALPAVEGEAWLVFDTAPDEITAKAWPVSKWGDLSAVDEAISVPVSGDKITLLEGGHIYEVFAKWTRFEEFGGAAYYSFYTSPLGVTLTAEDVTPNGLTLVCTQSGGAPTGELQTGSRFWLEVYSEGNWFPVKDDMEDVFWTMEAWSIPRNKRVEWSVSWETLYGSLPTGHYRIGKEITDFRAGGDYDKYNCYAEFTVE